MNLSQRGLANVLGVSHRTVEAWEAEKMSRPTRERVFSHQQQALSHFSVRGKSYMNLRPRRP